MTTVSRFRTPSPILPLLLRGAPLGLGLVVLFVSQVLLGRLLGPTLYGQYGYVLAWITTAAILSRAGHEWALMRSLPPLIDEGAFGRMRHLVVQSFAAVSVRAVVAMAVLAIALRTMTPSTWATCSLALGLAFVMAHAGLMRSFGLTHSAVWISDAPENLLKPLIIVALAWFATTHIDALGVTDLLSINLSVSIVALMLTSVLVVGVKARPLLGVHAEPFDLTETRSLTRTMFLANVMTIILRNADLLVVGVLATPLETGLYLAATRIAAIPSAIVTIVDPLAGPAIARASHAGDTRTLRRIANAYSLATTTVSAVALILFMLSGSHLVHLLFGDTFSGAATFAGLLLSGHLIANLTAPGGQMLSLSGNHLLSFHISTASTVAFLMLLVMLSYFFGSTGAAVAFVIGSSIKSTLLAVYVKRATLVSPTFLLH